MKKEYAKKFHYIENIQALNNIYPCNRCRNNALKKGYVFYTKRETKEEKSYIYMLCVKCENKTIIQIKNDPYDMLKKESSLLKKWNNKNSTNKEKDKIIDKLKIEMV